jgi:pimeloyl-ACP methyl ester carboxylesterase
LASAEVGDPTGAPVLYFHGAPTSRLDVAVWEPALVGASARVIGIDRPGYGGSTPQPGRTFDDWPADAAAVADAIGIDRFAVLGYSSGGPYALVCGVSLADRVTAVGLAAGVTDFGWEPAWDGYPAYEVEVMRIDDEAKAIEQFEQKYGADGSGVHEAMPPLTPADEALFADEVIATAWMASLSEAWRQGAGGFVEDMLAQARPWGFDVAAIRAPVHLLHGEPDTIVPIAHSRHTIELCPQAELTVFDDHGHLSLSAQIPDLVARITAR